MPNRIEDCAVIGNCETIALVGRNGSIDWLGLPRFDSAACFCALLGEPKNGRWLIAPVDAGVQTSRRYRGRTLILETVFRTAEGAACLTDFMVRREGSSDVVRIVRGLRGQVALRMELIVRFGYGSVTPWVSRQDDGRLQFIAGPDRLLLDAKISTRGEDFRTLGDFSVGAGQEVGFALNCRSLSLSLRRHFGAQRRSRRSISSGRVGQKHSSPRRPGTKRCCVRS